MTSYANKPNDEEAIDSPLMPSSAIGGEDEHELVQVSSETQGESGAKKTKRESSVERRERVARLNRRVRLGIQILFFVFAPAVFSGAFNGVKYIFTQIGLLQEIQMTSFMALLVVTLAFTVVFGRFFCGYACAFGALGDVLHGAAKYICSKLGVSLPTFPDAAVRALSLMKYVVLLGVCVACVTGVWSYASGYSPWTAFAGILALSVEHIDVIAFVVLALIAVGMIVRERFFCQFLCPLGAVFSLMPVFKFSEYTRVRAHCAPSCGKCRQSCPVDIWPDMDYFTHGECIACGKCADACPMNNVNLVAIEKPDAKRTRLENAEEGMPDARRPLRKTREAWYLLKGTGAGVVVFKAIALGVLFWIAGATRIVPAFSSLVGLG